MLDNVFFVCDKCAVDKTYNEDDLVTLLIQCRSERDLSLEDVAKVIRISIKGLSNIERKLSKPRRTTRLRIETFLRKHGYFPKVAA